MDTVERTLTVQHSKGYIITLIIFTVLGIQQTSGGYTAGDISNYITELNGEFHLGAVTLIPAILIIVLLLCKVNARIQPLAPRPQIYVILFTESCLWLPIQTQNLF